MLCQQPVPGSVKDWMFPASLRRKMQYPQQPLATAVIADRAAPPSATHAAVIEVFAEQPRPKQAGEWLCAWLSGMLPRHPGAGTRARPGASLELAKLFATI